MLRIVSTAAIGGFLVGSNVGVISGAQLYFDNDFPDITDVQRSQVVSLALLGAAVGSLFSGTISDKIGRKKVIMFADFMFTLGAIVMAWSPTITWLIVGRILVGIGVGASAQIVLVYLAEISPVEIRGKLIALNIAMATIGQVFSVILAYIIKPHWRIMLGLAGVPSIIQFIAIIFLPESPRWLGKQGQDERSRGVMQRVYKEEYLEKAVKYLEKEVEALMVETKMTEAERLKSLFTTYARCLGIGCAMQLW